jgi:membrane protease YdiL (CAAX protease family)
MSEDGATADDWTPGDDGGDADPHGQDPADEGAGSPDGALAVRPAATAGLAAAALALVGTAWGWPGEPPVAIGGAESPVALALAVAAALAFAARRHGALGPAGAWVAGATGVAASLAAVLRLLAPSVGGAPAPTVGLGLPLTTVAGLAVGGFAVADLRDVPAPRLVAMLRSVLVGVGLVVVGFVGVIVASLLLSPLALLQTGPVAGAVLELALPTLAEVGFVAVALGFLALTDRGLAFVDWRTPTLAEVLWTVASVVGLLVAQVVVSVSVTLLELPSSSQGAIEQTAQRAAELGRPEIVLALVPLMLFVVGPAEELLFRNVVQKYLYGSFRRTSAVLVAGVVFAVAHVPAYWDANPAAVFVSIASLFLISLLLGFVYEHTENLVVPAAAHGIFNALLVVFLYVGLLYGEMPA